MSHPLCERLATALDDARRASSPASDELEGELRSALDAARAAWPEVHITDDAIVAHLGRAIAASSAATVHAWLAGGTTRDLYLACACAAGDAAALAIFESRYIGGLDAALRRLAIEQPIIDDVKQHVRVALLVGEPGKPPRIATFTGAGNLGGWLRVIAINAARRLLRKRSSEPAQGGDDIVFEALADDHEHRELEFLKAKYRAQFALAFRAALAGLSARDRTLLRQHYMLGMSIDQLAVVHGTHRATCARWLAKCRETLYARTRSGLGKSLDIDRVELDHIMQLIESRLEVSVRRYLEDE